jgi:cyclopropane-fatty-acyl-phospholipid synthase
METTLRSQNPEDGRETANNSGLSMSTGRDTSQTDRLRGRSIKMSILHWIFRGLLKSKDSEIARDGEDMEREQNGKTIALNLPNLLRTIQILLKPDVMLGQSYVHGHWTVQPEKLYDFLYLIRFQEASKLQNWFLFSSHFHILQDSFKQRFFPIRSTRAVVEHYNTNASFMSLILGPSLSYTCAFFEKDGFSLEEAQERKLETIAERISLSEIDTVLDLGSGWGYAAFPLAEKYTCNVTGITISEAQVEFCNTRKLASPARERLQFLKFDYARYEPPSKFDKVISMGMLEHVGKYRYKFFFDKVAEFVRDDGVALIHSMVEERMVSPDAWIDKNIFPGGYIPTISEVISGIEQSNCELVKIFTHEKTYYFKTLEFWKRNLFANRIQCEDTLRERGLKDADITTIIRIWEYFLSSSQIAFSNKYGRCRIAHFVVRRKA